MFRSLRLPILLFATLALATQIFASQYGKLTGRIIDKSTREGIPGITVLITGTKIGTKSDVDGNYSILSLPVGTYSIRFSGIGYNILTVNSVAIHSDLTTNLDAQLSPEAVNAEEVIVTAVRPMLQKDLTASREIKSSDEIKAMPVNNIKDVIHLTAGVSGENFRGGRAGEVSYVVDGVNFVDPMTGNSQGDIPPSAIEELSVTTGGFSAEYGNAQSGLVQEEIKEGGPKFSSFVDYKISQFNMTKYNADRGLKNPTVSFEGPVPTWRSFPGSLSFFLAYEHFSENSHFGGDDSTMNSFTGKLTYNITPSHKLAFTTVYSDNQWRNYDHLWSRATNEDNTYIPVTGKPSPFDSWYHNGRLDTEDRNHNGVLDPGEDLNGDGIIQSEDLNHNGGLDILPMYTHLPEENRITRSFSLDWTHELTKETYYTVRLSRWETSLRWNVNENINEDANGNGIFENEQWYSIGHEPDSLRYVPEQFRHVDNPANPTREWFDTNHNGVQDHEDLNGNGVWDWKVYGPNTDLFADANDDGYIDASQHGPQIQWMRWQDIPFNNTKDPVGFFDYGNGLTYDRSRWHQDDRITTTLKGVITSQVHPMHQVKSGFEVSDYRIHQFDIDLASGGDVYKEAFDVSPRSYGLFAEDKIESEGMIVNAGFRFDWFDANFANYPADLSNPVINPTIGDTIRNPVRVKLKNYFSPRLGISFPFTSKDLLHFNYGRFFQNPRMALLFRNLSFDFSGAFPLIGNANLSPERTTSYEIGVKHLITNDMSVDITGFYKDITGLVDTKQVYYTATNWYGLYVNTDYGNVRGMEISFNRRLSNYIGGSANYTYSVAKGKSSTTAQGYLTAYYNQVPKTTEYYLDWDQRHVINLNLQFYVPKGSHLSSPWVNSALDRAGITFLFNYGSGFPFSSPSKDINPPINDMRLPATYYLDIRMDKTFDVTKEIKSTIYCQIFNVTDKRNIDAQYFQAGGPGGGETTIDPAWYLYYNQPEGRWKDPAVFQPGRSMQVGIQFSF